MPNGTYRITDRVRDMIIRGGENILPEFIEAFRIETARAGKPVVHLLRQAESVQLQLKNEMIPRGWSLLKFYNKIPDESHPMQKPDGRWRIFMKILITLT